MLEINKLYNMDCLDGMHQINNNFVDLIITSPPYNVGKEYEENMVFGEYLGFMEKVFEQCYRILKSDGRICINIGNMGRKPYNPYSDYFTIMMNKIGFKMIGEFIWDKGPSAGTSTAWGSWCSASCPSIRDVHEYILVFCKDEYKKECKGVSTITKEEFLEYTKSIWMFQTESARKIGHPAPFPPELPMRLIKLFSYEGDLILDPFAGSGTTLVVAKQLNRNYIGFEKKAGYCDITKRRLMSCWKPTEFII